MVECLKHEGTSHSSSDLLKICVKMGASWSAQVFRQAGDTPSGPAAFLILIFLKTLHPITQWCFFKPAIELMQIICQLLILHSAGGWCLITGYVFNTFPDWSRITGREFGIVNKNVLESDFEYLWYGSRRVLSLWLFYMQASMTWTWWEL